MLPSRENGRASSLPPDWTHALLSAVQARIFMRARYAEIKSCSHPPRKVRTSEKVRMRLVADTAMNATEAWCITWAGLQVACQ